MGKREYYKENNLKKLVYVFSITLILTIVIFLTILVLYNQKIKSNSNNFDNLGSLNEIVSNDDLKETSSSDDLKISDVSNNTSNSNTTKNVINKTPVEATVSQNISSKNSVTNATSNTVNNTVSNITDNNLANNEVNSDDAQEKEPEFMAPVSGDIIKDFTMESLIYSNTLEEWTTHSGIDIKANKTSIVVAAEEGKIESIKNDPRYGLTITIKHSSGYKTVYSNLLTTEFVSEGESVDKGQTIATVGDTASFEVSDDSHLHFEMYKDGECVNPTIYLK